MSLCPVCGKDVGVLMMPHQSGIPYREECVECFKRDFPIPLGGGDGEGKDANTDGEDN